MATAARTKPERPNDGQRFVLYGVGWQGYRLLLNLVGVRPIRLTYDRGNVEVMTAYSLQERCKYLFGRLIDAVTEELDIPVLATASTTFKRQDLDRGLKPDQCYYFGSAARIKDPAHIQLGVDPPPDLAFKVEISRSCLDRIGIYEALRVPEVWRFDCATLGVLNLQADGTYAPVETSGVLPFLPLADVARFLREYDQKNDTLWARAVRAWVRDEVVPRVRNG
jgi:Uma2 family endonuclease